MDNWTYDEVGCVMDGASSEVIAVHQQEAAAGNVSKVNATLVSQH